MKTYWTVLKSCFDQKPLSLQSLLCVKFNLPVYGRQSLFYCSDTDHLLYVLLDFPQPVDRFVWQQIWCLFRPGIIWLRINVLCFFWRYPGSFSFLVILVFWWIIVGLKAWVTTVCRALHIGIWMQDCSIGSIKDNECI